jgi:predicted exporter
MSRARAAGFVLVVLAMVVYAALAVRIDDDFSAFLPRGVTPIQEIVVKQLREGVAGRLLLVEVAGAAPERLAQSSRALAARLAADANFRYVNNGSADLGARELAAIEEYRYVLSDGITPERFSAAGLRDALRDRLDGLAASTGMLEARFLAADPTGETMRVLRRLVPATQPMRVHGVWFDPSGQRALLLAETRAPGADIHGQALALTALENAFRADSVDNGAKLRYSSPGAMAVASRSIIERDALRLSIISVLLIVAILGWVYRSAALVFLCAIPAAAGLLAGIAAVNLWFGSVHGITLAFGATLLGEAVDYPSYLLTQAEPGERVAAVQARIAATLRMAVLTTAGSAFALLFAGIEGLAQLGMLTMVGVLVAGAVTWYLLPRWVPEDWNPRWAIRQSAAAQRQGLPFGWRIVIVIALIAVVWIPASNKPVWDDDLAHMNPLPRELAAQDRELRAELGAPDARSLILVTGASSDDVLQKCEALRPTLDALVASGAVEGYELPCDYLPSLATQAQRRAALPTPELLHANLDQAMQGLPFRRDAFVPFEAAVEKARQRAPLTPEAFTGTAVGLKIDALLQRHGTDWVALIPLRAIKNPSGLVAKVENRKDAGVQLLDLRQESAAMMAAYRQRALASIGLGTLIIAGVLAQGLRSLARTLQVLVPVAAAILLTAGSLVIANQPLSVFHLIALLLIVGIGINYALFTLRAAELREERRRVVRTLAVVSGTTLAAFAMLATSSIPVLHAIGTTVTIGVLWVLALCALWHLSRPRAAAA